MKTYKDFPLKLLSYGAGSTYNYMLVSNPGENTVDILDIISQPIPPGGRSIYNIYYKHNDMLLILMISYNSKKNVTMSWHKDITVPARYTKYTLEYFLEEAPRLFKRMTLMAFS